MPSPQSDADTLVEIAARWQTKAKTMPSLVAYQIKDDALQIVRIARSSRAIGAQLAALKPPPMR